MSVGCVRVCVCVYVLVGSDGLTAHTFLHEVCRECVQGVSVCASKWQLNNT